MIVVFDTNVWIGNLYFRSPAAAAVHFYLQRKNATVALPEVIKLEVEAHLRQSLQQYRDTTRDGYERLLALFGRLREVVLPTHEQIEEHVSHFFERSGFVFREIEFTFETARRALGRTINKVPPSAKSQQFKDSVLWEDCLRLARDGEVLLVTSDTDFYEGQDTKRGMAAQLREEVASLEHPIRLLPGLPALLEEITEPVAVDETFLLGFIEKEMGPKIAEILNRDGWQGGERHVNAELFATENPQQAYVVFLMSAACERNGEVEPREATLTLKGECAWNPTTGEFSDLKPASLGLTFSTEEGEQTEIRHAYLYADGIVIGHREVAHSFRHKLQ